MASPLTPTTIVGRLVLRTGVYAWCLVGALLIGGVLLAGLTAVSSVVLPLLFAAVLAVLFRPSVAWLESHGMRKGLAAGAVVLALIVVVLAVVILTVKGIIDQTSRIGDTLAPALDELGVDASTSADVRDGIESLSPAVTEGFAKLLVSGVSTIGGLAAGAVLGVLIMYYLLKDGDRLLAWAVERAWPDRRRAVRGFAEDATRVLRDYARGRTALSGIVAFAVGAAAFLLGLPLVLTLVVVNFIGGYIPYIGAVVGGGLAVIVALAESGVPGALVMLGVVLLSNLLLENIVEPKVMGRTLDIHPLVVLLLTSVGGIVGGLVGLMLAVPIALIVTKAFVRFQSDSMLRAMADRARPRIETLLGTAPAAAAEPVPSGAAGATPTPEEDPDE